MVLRFTPFWKGTLERNGIYPSTDFQCMGMSELQRDPSLKDPFANIGSPLLCSASVMYSAEVSPICKYLGISTDSELGDFFFIL